MKKSDCFELIKSSDANPKPSRFAAIILAAGESSRFGTPKVLHNFKGKPFLSRIVDSLRSSGIEEILLVLGYRAESFIPQLPAVKISQVVINHDYRQGQFSSLQAGLRDMDKESAGAILCLIDQPHLMPLTYCSVIQQAVENPGHIIIPSRNARGGHPIFLPEWLFAEILSAIPRTTLRDLLKKYPKKTLRLEVGDDGLTEDIDTPEDLKRLESISRF